MMVGLDLFANYVRLCGSQYTAIMFILTLVSSTSPTPSTIANTINNSFDNGTVIGIVFAIAVPLALLIIAVAIFVAYFKCIRMKNAKQIMSESQ